MFWMDFHSKLHQFKFSSAPNGHESYSGIMINNLVYPKVSVQEGKL